MVAWIVRQFRAYRWYARCSPHDQCLRAMEAHSVRHTRLVFLVCASLLLSVSALPAEAQRPGGAHGPIIVHSPLLFRGHSPFYFGFAQWYPYPYPPPVFGFPFPGSFPGDHIVNLRLQVTPRDAVVYVDGYAAGIVDDYDGVFQRLRLVPGHHEVVIHQRGYRTLRQALYFNPGSTHTIKHTLVPLGPGEVEEAQPVPRAMPPMPTPGGGPPSSLGPDASRGGVLALRVQPADANVYIDGESWRAPQGQDRLVVQLTEGTHRLRVDKPGLQPFNTEVDVRAGETTSLNVSLVQ
jgi:hypothetical protein